MESEFKDKAELDAFVKQEKMESAIKWTWVFFVALAIIGIDIGCIVFLPEGYEKDFLFEWIAMTVLGTSLADMSIYSYLMDRKDLKQLALEVESELMEQAPVSPAPMQKAM